MILRGAVVLSYGKFPLFSRSIADFLRPGQAGYMVDSRGGEREFPSQRIGINLAKYRIFRIRYADSSPSENREGTVKKWPGGSRDGIRKELEREDFMKKIILVALIAFSVGILTALPKPQEMTAKKEGPVMMTKSSIELGMAMRKLWEDHITYTRNFIISSLAGLEDAGKIAERLLKNQDDIGDAIKPIYGAAAGTKLSSLLRDHILIAADVVKAAKAGAAADLDAASKKWTANADEIAVFLSGANPNWSRAELTDMLHKHLDYTTREVVSRLKKDWAADIAAYDIGHTHMLMFADMLTHGIVKQFPDKFKS